MNDFQSALIDSFIDSLPSLKKRAAAKDSCCPICLCSLKNLDKKSGGITRLPACEHMFCRNDLIKWIRDMNGTCPVCRNPFLDLNPPDPVEESSIGYHGISDEVDNYSFSNIQDHEEYHPEEEDEEMEEEERGESSDAGHYYHPGVNVWEDATDDPVQYSFGEGVDGVDHSHEEYDGGDPETFHDHGDFSDEDLNAAIYASLNLHDDTDGVDHSHEEYDGGDPETFHDHGDFSDEDLNAAIYASLNLHDDTHRTPDTNINEEYGDGNDQEEVYHGYGYSSYANEVDEDENRQHDHEVGIQGGDYYLSDEDNYSSDHDDDHDRYPSTDEYYEFCEDGDILILY
ncbi:hypothetical protein EV361DRAFT_483966 [Lentinula raphanica]|nr:hypothetical protein C8R42DRAFT_23909 [Lentinula raphanica]KAJ3773075.1 hypothetical protein FB446DRAFT_703347 [Lentinula raphanica]KAJ3975528.1 hypothetical protein EV361DRAFT_483966 [Lentinula raphanica]